MAAKKLLPIALSLLLYIAPARHKYNEQPYARKTQMLIIEKECIFAKNLKYE